mgnify:CR=1 FL=1
MSIGVAVHFFGDIHGIVDSTLAVDDGVVAIDCVSLHNGVVGVGSSTSRTSSTSHYSGIKGFATREGKDGYNHTQCQE